MSKNCSLRGLRVFLFCEYNCQIEQAVFDARVNWPFPRDYETVKCLENLSEIRLSLIDV